MVPKSYEEPLLRFFNFIFADKKPGDLIEIRVINGTATSRFFLNTKSAVDYIMGLRDNVFFGVVPRIRTGGKKEDVGNSYFLWADLDVKTGSSLTDLLDVPLPEPCVVVASGHGFHAYWKIRDPLALGTTPVVLEAANRSIAAVLRSDSVADAGRIMRVPYTMNKKPGQSDILATILHMKEDCSGHYLTSFLLDSSTQTIQRIRRAKKLELPEGHKSRSEELFAVAIEYALKGGSDLDELERLMYADAAGEKLNEMSPSRRREWIDLTFKNAKRTLLRRP